ncbi:glucose dehydrogenase [Pseudomonas psychrotolerans]|nr:glucose dehydrogenase [Pseudomonas psychrotolerans]
MTVTSSARPGGLPTRLLGILFILLGLALLGLGIKLATLGGSLYYLGGGVLLALSGYLLFIRRASGVWVYAFFLVVSTAWAVLEVQFDWWQLVPRLALWFVLGPGPADPGTPPAAGQPQRWPAADRLPGDRRRRRPGRPVRQLQPSGR